MIQSYPWYIADWRESETRIRLSLPERALYRELLDYCYLEGSLPTDPMQLSRIAGCTVGEIKRYLPEVEALFYRKEGRLFHAKVDDVRTKLEAYHEQKKHAGSASGRTRRARAVERALNGCSSEKVAPLKSSIGTQYDLAVDPPKSAMRSKFSGSIDSNILKSTESVNDGNARSTKRSTGVEPSPTPTPSPSPSHTKNVCVSEISGASFKAWINPWPRISDFDSAARAWISVIKDPDSEAAAFSARDRYLASDEVARGVVAAPHKWLFEQARSGWAGKWPAARKGIISPAAPTRINEKPREFSEAEIDRMLHDEDPGIRQTGEELARARRLA